MNQRTSEALPDIPGLPADGDEPVFSAPWQAQAFALAVSLNEAGHFTWGEWTDCFAPILKEAQTAPGADTADVNETYYQAWLKALERLVVQKGITTAPVLSERKDAWDRAARATPHGEPIILGREREES